MREYRIDEGSVHQRFLNSTAKLQVFGGGFGNGKTAAACVKAIKLLTDYPGCNGLIARATFPKLNDTIRKEFKHWCPPSLIRTFPESKNSDNTAKFTNGSQVNFRYIAQQGKGMEQSTSNLLSATYDFMIVDQMEDPEITEKDFYDLLGRLRGNAIYRGVEAHMPKTGPRFFMMTVNPTGNWFYKRIVRPIKIYEATGKITDDLLCERDEQGMPILVAGKPIMLIELFEAPTYANAKNLGADFIKTLESTYRGQMRDRFLMGEWASYEGLVYPQYNDINNLVTHNDMLEYMNQLGQRQYQFKWREGYDFGIASPSCYLLSFTCPNGAVHVVDGFYRKEMSINDQVNEIKRIRAIYGVSPQEIYGDPSIFRRMSTTAKTVGKSTSELFYDASGQTDHKITFRRGNNDILNGILKVGAYLSVQPHVTNPYSGQVNAPLMYFSDKLTFLQDEITGYMWQKDAQGKPMDKPNDRDDHAMDTLKYLMTDTPEIGQILLDITRVPKYMQWHEHHSHETPRYARYGH